MKIKTILLLWLILSLTIGIFVYNITPEIYTYISPLGVQTWSLPIALWMLVPMTLFFLIVLIGSFGVKVRAHIKEYHHKRDFELLIHQFFIQATSGQFHGAFKTDYFLKISQILQCFLLVIKPDTSVSDVKEIDTFIEVHNRIFNGEVVDIKHLQLPYDAPLNIQNQLNRLKSKDSKIALEILRKGNAPDSLKNVALLVLFSNKEEKEFRKYKDMLMSPTLARTILDSYTGKECVISAEEIASFGISASYQPKEYLVLARKLKEAFEPDIWIKLFETIATKAEHAEEAYLYALLDLEMISVAQERLATHGEEDFKKVRAFLELRKGAEYYPAEIFFF